MQREIATLGGGCFWCLEPLFSDLTGVTDVVVGYAGGESRNPTYQQICTGTTGHAEVVEISFDPAAITFKDILQHFFSMHDPTKLNRQGNDRGTQYRSVLYYHSDRQQQTACEVIDELTKAGIWPDPIVTEVTAVPEFFKAEKYHQHYFKNNPAQPYCQIIIAPKVARSRSRIQDALKSR